MSLEQAYEQVKNRIPKGQEIDSLSVVKQVEEYRQFWKPTQINVLLLAESHVFTSQEELQSTCILPLQNRFIMNYPTHYVRFVYCLGYGEPEMLNLRIENNLGTNQYWKIFSSSIAKNDKDVGQQRFQDIKKDKTSLLQRLRNKVNILQEMKRKGIWLLDASIVGIAGSVTDSEVKEKIISTCWDSYIQGEIIDSPPKHIIVVGKSVEGILKWRLELLKASMKVNYSALPQPQGIRKDKITQLENYREFQRICSKYAP
jgi:hypothetical protein